MLCTLDMDICSRIYYSTYVCMYAFYSTMYVHFMYACKLVCNQTSLCSMYACIFMIFDHVCMKFRARNPLRASKICVNRRAIEELLRQGPTPLGQGPTPLGEWRLVLNASPRLAFWTNATLLLVLVPNACPAILVRFLRFFTQF